MNNTIPEKDARYRVKPVIRVTRKFTGDVTAEAAVLNLLRAHMTTV